jgi:hypothetical protein
MRKLFAVVALSLVAASGAKAACYDVFGCTERDRFRMSDLMSGPNCEFLYTMRNQIYADHGYCFKTARARATFGNAGCVTGDANALGLSGIERANAATILQAEKAKGCQE